MSKNILFVDDEKQILNSIRRLFLKSNYVVFLAGSGTEALEVLKSNHIDLMVTDMRMPGMDGYQLLEKVKKLYPNTLRLILSGYTDEEQIFRAIQNNLARVYMFKPWDNEGLIKLIEQMMEFEAICKEKSILAIIDKIDSLPTLPDLYNRLCTAIDEDINSDQIAAIIEEDQCISAKVLQVANSSFYSIKAGSIKQAILYLGLNNVKNIIFVTNVFNMDEYNAQLGLDLLWKHANSTNKILHCIYSKLLNKKLSESFSTAGLLHDIGKIIEIQHFKDDYIKLQSRINEDPNSSPLILEREIFKTTHSEIGAYLLDWWGVPHSIIEAALYHHIPLDDRVVNKELVCTVHIADHYSWEMLDSTHSLPFQEATLDYLNITKEACDDLINHLQTV